MDEALKEKVQKQHSDLVKAFDRLREALGLPPTRIHKDATIQRFEFTFELCWKLMQSISNLDGIAAYGPKQSIRAMAQLGYVDDPEAWMSVLNARNYTPHLYNEDIADEVYNQAKHLPALGDKLLTIVGKKLMEDTHYDSSAC